MTFKRGLGKGLQELLSTTELLSASAERSENNPAAGAASHSNSIYLPIEKIRPSRFQPRRDFNEENLKELAQSIKKYGIIQPLIVRRADENYEIIAGERRWRAALIAQLSQVPANIHQISDEEAMAFALIENIQRQNLNPIEEARAIQRLSEEFAMTHQDLADSLGKSRTTITNLLRLLQLEDTVKHCLERGEIEMGHAKVLLGLEKSEQLAIAKQIIELGLSVRATEKLIQNKSQASAQVKTEYLEPDPDLIRLERDLSEKLGTRVSIKHKNNGQGTLTIHYYSLDDLDNLLQKF